jgi:hypothetical protein
VSIMRILRIRFHSGDPDPSRMVVSEAFEIQ